jgi:hypothetical protein
MPLIPRHTKKLRSNTIFFPKYIYSTRLTVHFVVKFGDIEEMLVDIFLYTVGWSL